MSSFNYGIDRLTIGKVLAIASGTLKGVLNEQATRNVRNSQQHVERIVANNKTVYGVNTGCCGSTSAARGPTLPVTGGMALTGALVVFTAEEFGSGSNTMGS